MGFDLIQRGGGHRALAAAGMFALGLGAAGLAETEAAEIPFTFSEDFVGEDGTQPANWRHLIPEGPNNEILDNQYRLRRQDGSGGQARAFAYEGVTENPSDVSEQPHLWQDYTVTAVFEDSRTFNQSGVFARWDGGDITGNDPEDWPGGYIAYQAGDTLHIGRTLEWGTPAEEDLASSNLTEDFKSDNPYRIEFTVSGENLSARLYDLDGGNETLVGEVSTTDDTYTTGGAGIRTNFTFHSRQSLWDTFEVEGTAIPEPGSLALLGAGGMLMMFGRRRGRRA